MQEDTCAGRCATSRHQRQRRNCFETCVSETLVSVVLQACHAAGCLGSTAFIHDQNIAHESLGVGSFMMSTVSDERADQLVVKLDNFGVAKGFQGGEGVLSALAKAQKRDCEALAVTFCELAFSAIPV
jgi:hypothetical protein